jgi:hypothetical protein
MHSEIKLLNDKGIKVGDYFVYGHLQESIFRLVQESLDTTVRILGVTSGCLYESYNDMLEFKEKTKGEEVIKVVPKYYDVDRGVMVFTEV